MFCLCWQIDKRFSGTDEEDQQDGLLDLPKIQNQGRHRYKSRPRLHLDSTEETSKELSEFLAKEMNQMAEDSAESGLTDIDESETSISIHSAPLPQSIDSSEELAKLRPRIDVRLCPSPG